MLKRPIAPYERFYVETNCYVQLALKCKEDKSIEPLLKKISKCVLGLHLSSDGQSIYTKKRNVPVYKLPDTFKNLEEASLYMADHHTRPIDQALASVGSNKDTIVLNINHLAADGCFLLYLFNLLKNDAELIVPETIEPVEETFKREIVASTYKPMFVAVDPDITRIKPYDTDFINNYPLHHHFRYQSDIHDLKCYNKSHNKVNGLTDHLWSNLILATSAHNDSFDKQGCATCFNLRPFLKDINFGHANTFSSITVLSHANKDSTLGEMMKQIRNDFNDKVRKGAQFGYLKSLGEGTPKGNAELGIGLELSNVGIFNLGGPFKDMWLNLTMRQNGAPGIVSYLTFGVNGEGKHDLYSKMRFAPQRMSDREASLIVKSVHYALEHFSPEMRCGEIIDILKDYQKDLSRDFHKELNYKIPAN